MGDIDWNAIWIGIGTACGAAVAVFLKIGHERGGRKAEAEKQANAVASFQPAARRYSEDMIMGAIVEVREDVKEVRTDVGVVRSILEQEAKDRRDDERDELRDYRRRFGSDRPRDE
ncbi:hypothetical protein [Consotaella aegiceratis]|uniref:hypothetical protein n=1 Tax=Consotaella aegiceratis TaxID=3097961 RepID=UPI002F3ED967